MTADWLAPVMSALDAAERACPIFFRDDDAGWDDAGLGRLLDLFAHHGVPVDVAVIPNEITSPMARSLLARAGHGRARLHQHGYSHVNREPQGRKCEFGASRPVTDQQGDISAGRRRMLEVFGPFVDPVFTPPWNRCSAGTAAALVAEGLTILSRDATAIPFDRRGLAEVPITVDWMGHHKGVRWDRAELGGHLAESIVGGGPVGVMLHHAHADATERKEIGRLLAVLAAQPSAWLTNILPLATSSGSLRAPSGPPGMSHPPAILGTCTEPAPASSSAPATSLTSWRATT